ncbi:hypothetical protein BC829DRAFT_398865 [Chytridium lagenaria]|nr:hypothetical protein BC829DRAFT_398865 [Chytridium lagenaria]
MIGKRFECTTKYEPRLEDEVTLRVGDVVVVERMYNDGWAFGTNETLGLSGAFPLYSVTNDDALSTASS